MIDVEVIAAVRFRHILVSALEVPLADAAAISASEPVAELASLRGVVVANSPIHEKDSAAHVLPVEIAADAGLLDLNFAGAERLSRADDGVVDRLVEIFHVVRVESDFRREERRVERRCPCCAACR